jgi:hypothetical protein
MLTMTKQKSSTSVRDQVAPEGMAAARSAGDRLSPDQGL